MRRRSMLALLTMVAALLGPSVVGGDLPKVARVALVGLGLLIMPGDTVARAAGLTLKGVAERCAAAFTFSLALLVPGLLIALASGTGVETVVAVLLVSCTLLTWRSATRTAAAPVRDREQRENGGAGLGLVTITLLTLIALSLAAIAATRTGSIDRWWYLGYVRAWTSGPLFAHEPFLGTGFVQPRFAFHTWLGALAVWARLSGTDPLWLFDRACPAFLMPLAFAAQAMFGRALFGTRRGAMLTALCASLLWAGGGPIAALTRLPEDKVLAALVLSPVLWASGVRACDRGGAWVVATGMAAVAIATIHPLGFLLSAGPLGAFCAIRGWREPRLRRAIGAVALVLAITSSYPLVSGWIVRRAYVTDGAAKLTADHPVARVHRSRQRLVDVGAFGYVVDPNLLAHPIIWIALAALPLLRRRSAREASFLAPAALVPLAVAFVPPLSATAGAVILPWMVHRVLWSIPFGALAAVAAEDGARRLGGRTGLVAFVLVVVSTPWAFSATTARMRAEREALVLPAAPALHTVLKALRLLPAEAILAAAPELSERVPGLTGAHVLAMSDRATIVFAGSRAAGEARLRERAEVFAGLWQPSDDAPAPTHVLFAPGSAASRYCGHELLRNDGFVLCTFAGVSGPPNPPLPDVDASQDGVERVSPAALLFAPAPAAEIVSQQDAHDASVSAHCEPQPRLAVPGPAGLTRARPGPWSAEFPSLSCSFEGDTAALLPRTLVLVPALGMAVEELTIRATGLGSDGERWDTHARRRVHNGETLRVGLPRGAVDRVVIEITPSFLPFVKLRGFELTLETSRGQP